MMDLSLERLIKSFKKKNLYLTFDYNDSPAEIYGGMWERVDGNLTLWTTVPKYDNSGNMIDDGGVGNIVAAGLPNIKGQWWSYSWGTATEKHDAVTTVLAGNRNCKFNTDANSGIANDQKIFNANEYNDIYSDEIDTVQPPAIKVYLWRKVVA